MISSFPANPPLDGVRCEIAETLPPAVVAECANLLAALGAAVSGDLPREAPERERVPGLPLGTLELLWGALAAINVLRGGDDAMPSRADALRELLLPAILSGGRWHQPSLPVPVRGGGHVCADVAAPDDAEGFERFNAAVGDRFLDAESISAEAQLWRLPVTPYRSRPPQGHAHVWVRPDRQSTQTEPAPAVASVQMTNPVVVDLTVMWAGPLCTRLLSDAGATVHKIEPTCRLDGTRLDAHGLHDALNSDKIRHDLDLRIDDQRAAFANLVSKADLVIDNFSPRVRPNLGITRAELLAINPEVMTLSLPAFPAGTTERQWVAYGTGVHAISGLGMTSVGPHSPAITYPDPIAGAIGAATATAMLVGRLRGWRQRQHGEVSLACAIEPLLDVADDGGATLRSPLDKSALTALGVPS